MLYIFLFSDDTFNTCNRHKYPSYIKFGQLALKRSKEVKMPALNATYSSQAPQNQPDLPLTWIVFGSNLKVIEVYIVLVFIMSHLFL